MAELRIPGATYRVQFHRRFRFESARGLAPYLHALGITDLYASPILQARRGSTHGYDVTDPTRLNAELGSGAQFNALVKALGERGMGLLLDIVPNHMAAHLENRWWMDVLESGPGSPFAGFFDIDWNSPKIAMKGKVLLPILEGPYGRMVEEQMLSMHLEKSGLTVHYHLARLPVSIQGYPRILSLRLPSFEETYGPDHPSFRELWQLISDIEHLPKAAASEPEGLRERNASEEGIKERLFRLYTERHEIREYIDETLRTVNGRKGDAASFDLLDRTLSEQHYWLSFWRLADEEINYRRFFAVSDLVSLKVEDPRVFDAAHDLVLRLAAEGKVTGLRVDHVDGLHDPHGYLVRLMRRLTGSEEEEPPAAFYVLVEKILGGEETLPPEWPVFGTTGYDFLNALNGVFVSSGGVKALDDAYARFVGNAPDFAEIVYRSKKQVMETLLAGEMHSLGQHLGRLAEQDRYARDLPRKELRAAVVEVTACFPVYRSYARGGELSARDIRNISKALRAAQQRTTEVSAPVFDFLRRVLLLETPSPAAGDRQEWLRFLMRWQQFTGPIMAKGFEDTALYIYNRLVSANEVGGNPAAGGTPVNDFHARCATAAARWPHGMNTTSTHDTKRGEDVRARINVLSEIPEEWEERLRRWSGLNSGRRRVAGGTVAPGPGEEILLYQTLLGAWPLEAEEFPAFEGRIAEYMVKALREAKVNTRWIRPNLPYENAVREFIGSLLAGAPSPGGNEFLADFLPFQRKIARYGAINGLAQLVVKIAAPGVPDIYQGCELWDLSLVDPDNRRPVDFGKRVRLLDELLARGRPGQADTAGELLSSWRDGRIKLYLTWKGLAFRRERADLFRDGSYLPLPAAGAKREHALAFGREKGGRWAIAAVTRLSTRLAPEAEFPVGEEAWGAKTVLRLPEGAPGRWRNVFTGETADAAGPGGERTLPLREVFRILPVALLESA